MDEQPENITNDSSSDDKKDVTSDMISKERFNSVVSGQGKRIKQLEAENAKLAEFKNSFEKAEEERQRKTLEAKGEYEKILQKVEIEKKEMAEKLQMFQEQELKRLETVSAANEARIKKLPKELQALIPHGLTPDGVSLHLNSVETLYNSKAVNIHGGGGRDDFDALDPEAKYRALQNRGKEWLFGKNKKKK